MSVQAAGVQSLLLLFETGMMHQLQDQPQRGPKPECAAHLGIRLIPFMSARSNGFSISGKLCLLWRSMTGERIKLASTRNCRASTS